MAQIARPAAAKMTGYYVAMALLGIWMAALASMLVFMLAASWGCFRIDPSRFSMLQLSRAQENYSS